MFQEPAERTNTENHFWMLVIFGHSDDTALIKSRCDSVMEITKLALEHFETKLKTD